MTASNAHQPSAVIRRSSGRIIGPRSPAGAAQSTWNTSGMSTLLYLSEEF
jgi:hypothetical protein